MTRTRTPARRNCWPSSGDLNFGPERIEGDNEPLDGPSPAPERDGSNNQLFEPARAAGPGPYAGVLQTAAPPDVLVLSDQPGQPADSRWRLAGDRARRAGYLPPLPHPDPLVERCTAYLLALLACRGEPDRQRLAEKEPGLDAAVRLYTGGDKIARGTVEARLLARQSVPEVAALCGLTA